MDLAVSIAVRPSAQVALRSLPYSSSSVSPWVDRSTWPAGTFEVVSVALAVADLRHAGCESDWLEGAFLLLVYGMLGVAFFYY